MRIRAARMQSDLKPHGFHRPHSGGQSWIRTGLSAAENHAVQQPATSLEKPLKRCPIGMLERFIKVSRLHPGILTIHASPGTALDKSHRG
ncbi:hypothetical protein EVA_04288 [gut metagenome]|uniref:Uncharacterized protein n=1 Tax=gut metagenome TaxID=749906 RepID=J9H277_9ZZZZ